LIKEEAKEMLQAAIAKAVFGEGQAGKELVNKIKKYYSGEEISKMALNLLCEGKEEAKG